LPALILARRFRRISLCQAGEITLPGSLEMERQSNSIAFIRSARVIFSISAAAIMGGLYVGASGSGKRALTAGRLERMNHQLVLSWTNAGFNLQFAPAITDFSI